MNAQLLADFTLKKANLCAGINFSLKIHSVFPKEQDSWDCNSLFDGVVYFLYVENDGKRHG